jgi:hypothetical protein
MGPLGHQDALLNYNDFRGGFEEPWSVKRQRLKENNLIVSTAVPPAWTAPSWTWPPVSVESATSCDRAGAQDSASTISLSPSANSMRRDLTGFRRTP